MFKLNQGLGGPKQINIGKHSTATFTSCTRGRTGLVVRASDSGSGDPGSILGRVGVLFPSARDIYSPKVLVIPRNRCLRLNMTEKLFTGTLNHN